MPTFDDLRSGQPVTQKYRYTLPFFAVRDSHLSDAQKLLHSPTYIVERTDEFVVQQQFYNDTKETQQSTWQVTEGFSKTDIENFSETTGVETSISTKAGGNVLAAEVELSASLKLSQTFTYGFSTSSTLSRSVTRTFPVTVPPGKLSVLWSVQSSFRVFRQDGTAIGSVLTGIAPNSVAATEYSPQEGVDLSVILKKNAARSTALPG